MIVWPTLHGLQLEITWAMCLSFIDLWKVSSLSKQVRRMIEGERPSSPEPPAGSETGFSLMYLSVVGWTVGLSHEYVYTMVLMYGSLRINRCGTNKACTFCINKSQSCGLSVPLKHEETQKGWKRKRNPDVDIKACQKTWATEKCSITWYFIELLQEKMLEEVTTSSCHWVMKSIWSTVLQTTKYLSGFKPRSLVDISVKSTQLWHNGNKRGKHSNQQQIGDDVHELIRSTTCQ